MAADEPLNESMEPSFLKGTLDGSRFDHRSGTSGWNDLIVGNEVDFDWGFFKGAGSV